MASAEDRAQFNRGVVKAKLPILPFPKIPEAAKNTPERKEGWDKFEREVDKWRKTLPTPTELTVSTQTTEELPPTAPEPPAATEDTLSAEERSEVITLIDERIADAEIDTEDPVVTVTEMGIQKHIWLAVRTDGRPGTGKCTDPFDASTPDKFDAIIRAATTFTAIHLMPGVFQTYGWNEAGVSPLVSMKAGMRLYGAGMYVTTLKLVGTLVPAGYKYWVLGNHTTEISWHPASATGPIDYAEVHDMTLDANSQNLLQTACVGGVVMGGNWCRLKNVRVIHWGNGGGAGVEGFVLVMGWTSPADGVMHRNNVVEGCIVEKPVRITTGSGGVFMMLPSGTYPGVTVASRPQDCVVRNCVFDGQYLDGTIPPWPETDANRRHVNGVSSGGVTYENNIIRNCGVGGPYQDTNPVNEMIIRNNQYRNVWFGVFMNRSVGTQYMTNKLVIENNQFELVANGGVGVQPIAVGLMNYGVAYVTTPQLVEEAIIRGNNVRLVDDNYNPVNYDLAAIFVCQPLFCEVADNVIYLPYSQGVAGEDQAHILIRGGQYVNVHNNRNRATGLEIFGYDDVAPAHFIVGNAVITSGERYLKHPVTGLFHKAVPTVNANGDIVEGLEQTGVELW